MPFDPQVQAIHDRLERDQPARVCRSLAEAGVPVELTRYDGMPHAFFTMIGELDTARSAVAAAAARLREAFG
jgi:acetyl esterase